MTIKLLDSTWQRKFNGQLDSNIQEHYLGNFSSEFVVIKITSVTANAAWNQAGSIAQAITFDNEFAYGEAKNITLNKYLLLQFPIFSGTDYDLYYFSLPRLGIIDLSIWEYTGQIEETLIKDLIDNLENNAVLTVDFSSIKSQLNDLISSFQNNQNDNLLVSYLPQLFPMPGIF